MNAKLEGLKLALAGTMPAPPGEVREKQPASSFRPDDMVSHHGERYRVTGTRYGHNHTVELQHMPEHGESSGWAQVKASHMLHHWHPATSGLKVE